METRVYKLSSRGYQSLLNSLQSCDAYFFFPFFSCYLSGCCKTLETTLRTNRRRRTNGRFVGFLGVSPRSKRMVNVFFFTCGWKFNVFFTKRGDIWRIKSTRRNLIIVVPWRILVVVASASLSIFISMAWWEIKFFMRICTHIKVIWCECLCMWSSLDLNCRDDKVV